MNTRDDVNRCSQRRVDWKVFSIRSCNEHLALNRTKFVL